MKELEGRCMYPKCNKKSKYAPMKITNKDWLHLCEEHYNLWNFLDNLLFLSKVTINMRESRLVTE